MVAEFARQSGLTGDYSGLRSSATPISATLGLPKPWQIRFRVVWQRCILTPVLLIAPRSRLNALYVRSLCRTQPKRRDSQEVRFSPLRILPHGHILYTVGTHKTHFSTCCDCLSFIDKCIYIATYSGNEIAFRFDPRASRSRTG